MKVEAVQQNREELRNKIKLHHNKVMDLEFKCGVRLGMISKSPMA